MGRASHFLSPLLRDSDARAVLYVSERPEPVAVVIETAFDSKSRNKGLLGRDGLPDDVALIIAPTSAIHTFGMRFPIDVIYCAKNGRIVKVRPNMPPARISFAIGAFAVIEMAAGTIERHALHPGHVLSIGSSDRLRSQ